MSVIQGHTQTIQPATHLGWLDTRRSCTNGTWNLCGKSGRECRPAALPSWETASSEYFSRMAALKTNTKQNTFSLNMKQALTEATTTKQWNSSPIPTWWLMKAHFEITQTRSEEDRRGFPCIIFSKISHSWYTLNHFQALTDKSVLESEQAGAGFVIPELKMEKYYYLGKRISFFFPAVQFSVALHPQKTLTY